MARHYCCYCLPAQQQLLPPTPLHLTWKPVDFGLFIGLSPIVINVAIAVAGWLLPCLWTPPPPPPMRHLIAVTVLLKAVPQQPHCTPPDSWLILAFLSASPHCPIAIAACFLATAVADAAATVLHCCRYLCPCFVACAIAQSVHVTSDVNGHCSCHCLSLWHCRRLGPWYMMLPSLSV